MFQIYMNCWITQDSWRASRCGLLSLDWHSTIHCLQFYRTNFFFFEHKVPAEALSATKSRSSVPWFEMIAIDSVTLQFHSPMGWLVFTCNAPKVPVTQNVPCWELRMTLAKNHETCYYGGKKWQNYIKEISHATDLSLSYTTQTSELRFASGIARTNSCSKSFKTCPGLPTSLLRLWYGCFRGHTLRMMKGGWGKQGAEDNYGQWWSIYPCPISSKSLESKVLKEFVEATLCRR